MKQIDGDILKDKLKVLLEHYQYRDDDFAIGRTCALADAMELIDMQEKAEAIPVEWFTEMIKACGMQGQIGAVAAMNWVLDEWKATKDEWQEKQEAK